MSSSDRLAIDLVVRRIRWWLVPFVVVAAILVVAAVGSVLPAALLLIPTWLLFAQPSFEFLDSRAQARVEIDSRGIFVDGKKRLSTDELRGAAYLAPRENKPLSVHFPTRAFWKSFALEVADDEQGLELLSTMGQDPARTAARFRLATFEIGVPWEIIAMLTFWSGVLWSRYAHRPTTDAPMLVIWLAAIVFAGIALLTPSYITIGAEGIFLQRLARRRFIPFPELAAVGADPKSRDALVLRLVSGQEITLRTDFRDRKKKRSKISEQALAIQKRIEGAAEAFRLREPTNNPLAVLDRAGRTTAMWIASLEKTSAASGYRVAPVSNDQLWRVVEDPAASPNNRAAALVALRGSLDEVGRARGRRVIDACAEPRLRVAFDAAANEDVATLEAALDALVVEEQTRNSAKK